MPDWNYKEWFEATRLRNENGEPFSKLDLDPYYERVEKDTSVREYKEWDDGLKKIASGFETLGHPFRAVKAYVDERCDHSGCLFGCPTEAKRGTLVCYIIPSVLMGAEIFHNCTATRVLFSTTPHERPKARGVEFVNEKGEKSRIESKIVIVSCGALNTPNLLLDSGIKEACGHSPSSKQIGRNFGANTATIVFGRFDEVLNNWLLHPLSGCMDEFSQKEKGGFLLEASEVMEGPLGFAEFLVDEEGVPLWGERQKRILKDYRHFAGVFINIHDQNDGRVFRDPETGQEKFHKPITSSDEQKIDKSRSLCKEAFRAAGATETIDSIYASHHVQGTCRMGEDRDTSVVNLNCETHDVEGLYIVDGSILPSVIDANPSLTIMALSLRAGRNLLAEKEES